MARYYCFFFFSPRPHLRIPLPLPVLFQLPRGKLKVFLPQLALQSTSINAVSIILTWNCREKETYFLHLQEMRLYLGESHHHRGWLMWVFESVGSCVRSDLEIPLVGFTVCIFPFLFVLLAVDWIGNIYAPFLENYTHTHKHILQVGNHHWTCV